MTVSKLFKEFELAFDSYCKSNFVNYYVADSKANKDPSIIWNFRQYKCVHGQDPDKIKSHCEGTRPTQAYNAKGCTWALRCCFNLKTKKYFIKSFDSEHINCDGHEASCW